MAFTRISVDPGRCGGVPCIRDLRIPVATVVSMVAEGQTHEEIIAELPELELEDIREALRYAAEAVRERELPLLTWPGYVNGDCQPVGPAHLPGAEEREVPPQALP